MSQAAGIYITTRGELHARLDGPSASSQPPLLMLHPLPHSGAFFDHITALIAPNRRVLRPDYPGFGDSPPLPQQPTIEAYGEILTALLDTLGIDGPVDVVGFHTGCLVAVEMALQMPNRLRRLHLVDIPYFAAEKREAMMVKIAANPDYDATAVAGFQAAMDYDVQNKFAQCRHSCLCIATGSALAEATVLAASDLPVARLGECPHIAAPAMENGAEELAQAFAEFSAEP